MYKNKGYAWNILRLIGEGVAMTKDLTVGSPMKLIWQFSKMCIRDSHTVYGIWKYFTADDGQICLAESDYLMIGTLEAYEQIRNYFGTDKVCPVYVEVDDGLRLQRALDRERAQDQPKYAEMCRRFLADEEDFSEENLEDVYKRQMVLFAIFGGKNEKMFKENDWHFSVCGDGSRYLWCNSGICRRHGYRY